jgi:hypothetical protein
MKTSASAAERTVKWLPCCDRAWPMHGKPPKSSEIKGEFLAIDTAMDKLTSGDLCLILVDQVEAALAYIEARIQKG